MVSNRQDSLAGLPGEPGTDTPPSPLANAMPKLYPEGTSKGGNHAKGPAATRRPRRWPGPCPGDRDCTRNRTARGSHARSSGRRRPQRRRRRGHRLCRPQRGLARADSPAVGWERGRSALPAGSASARADRVHSGKARAQRQRAQPRGHDWWDDRHRLDPSLPLRCARPANAPDRPRCDTLQPDLRARRVRNELEPAQRRRQDARPAPRPGGRRGGLQAGNRTQLQAPHPRTVADELARSGNRAGGDARRLSRRPLTGSSSRRSPRWSSSPSSCRAGTPSRRRCPSASGCGAGPTSC